MRRLRLCLHWCIIGDAPLSATFVLSMMRCVTLNEYEHEEQRTFLSEAEQLVFP